MKFCEIFLLFVISSVISTMAVAQTRGLTEEFSVGLCTARFIEPVTDSARGAEWQISYTPNGAQVIRDGDLNYPPFSSMNGGERPRLTTAEVRRPVFACTEDSLYLLAFVGQEVWLAKKPFVGDAEVLYRPGDRFVATDRNGGELVGRYVATTGILAMDNRVVIAGRFGFQAESNFAFELTREGSPKLLFDFGRFDFRTAEQACITDADLFFIQSVGGYQQLFVVHDGEVYLRHAAYQPFGVSCGKDRATILQKRQSDNDPTPLPRPPQAGANK